MSSTALASGAALTVLTMIAPPLRADVVVNPDNNGFADVRFGAGFTLLTNPVANFLDLRPDDLFVGNNFAGELKLFKPLINSGVVQNGNGIIGKGPIANGKVTVEGGSIWNNEGALTVAQQGTGTLDIKSAGQVFATSVTLGDQADSTGTVTIDGAGSKLGSTSTLLVGNAGTGMLNITNGGLSTGPLQIGTLANSTGAVTVDGAGSRLESNILGMTAFSDSTGTLSITDGGVVEVTSGSVTVGPSGGGPISGSDASVIVDGPGSMLGVVNAFFKVGNIGGSGTLAITNGGVVNAGKVDVAVDGIGTTGVITVDGSGSQLNATIGIILGTFGTNISATLDIRNGGFVSTKNLFVAVDAADNLDGRVFVQSGGALRVEDGITVLGDLTLAGGTLIFAGDRVYDAAPGDKSNLNGVLNPRAGVLSVGETVKIEGQLSVLSPITLDGGGLSAGSIPNIASVDFQRGLLELTGVDLDVTDAGQFGDTVSLGATQHLKISQTVRVATDGRVELSGGRLGAGLFENHGVVTGNGRIDGPLDNTSTGEIRVSSGDSLLFTGTGNTNAGDINLLGASDLLGTTLEFQHDLTNSATGRISGRGTLIASGGLTNQGVMALSGGFTDVFGDISVTGGASVEVNGGAVATFHDDFDNNGNVTVSPNSEVVFLGDVTGAGSFLGTGIATFEAALSPGNSPGEVTFDGDVVLGNAATLKLEIGGLAAGTQHDFLDVAGQFSADGTLDIQLLAGFLPGASDIFTLLDAGSLLGKFDNIATGGRLPTSDGGGSFVVNYGAASALADNQLILTNFLVDTGLPGDFDNDGDVDGGDFLKWQRGMSPNPLSGSDLSAWESNFGNVTAPLASAHAVPEPSTAIMLIFAAIGIGYRRCSAGNRVAPFPNESLR